ncbi:hypothetical protein SKAU_G00130460 [Synaphobranchus kaupii]|uniref:Jupiter microtubule associated homolog 2 n=1 Tax=Synaphobranchus kaupii TaxID=118154 RepID=A0A9Q1FQZ2_SYNKA|nr:hypothetical protein SKAU_G00130460 [Synaphobranchus kaupii]
MSSTNTFQGIDANAKPSSRVLRPPGGGSSNLFGGGDEPTAGIRSHKMTSTIFAPPEEPLGGPKRTNPPGGKSSGIFDEAQTRAPQQRPVPSIGSSNIFWGAAGNLPTVRSHPNKPKDNIGVNGTPQPEAPRQVERPAEKVKGNTPAPSTPTKESPLPQAGPAPSQPSGDSHEPRLGPIPRSHNKVIHPPGGKSSVAFY